MRCRKYPEVEVCDKVRSLRKKKQREKDRMGNFEEGAQKLKETKQPYDDEKIPHARADTHLIEKQR